jgi:hypothetical protein
MLAFLTPTPTPGRAAAILRQIFGGLPASFAFRLWDGQEVRFGSDAPACVAVIKSPETFLQLIRDPSPYNFAEAYVQSRIDLDGDLFSAMDVANVVETIKVTSWQKLAILLSLWRR